MRVEAEENWLKRLPEIKQGKVKIDQINRNKGSREVRLMLKEVDSLEVDQQNLLFKKTNNSKQLVPFKLRPVLYI